MTIEERSKNIIHDIKMEQGKNPVKIFEDMISKEYICMRGPEHHILDSMRCVEQTMNFKEAK